MGARSFAAAIAGMVALLSAGPTVAREADSVSAERRSLGDDLLAVKRDVLLLVSAGLSRLGMWTPAAAVSRQLVAVAEDDFDVCVAQAAVTWQTAEASSGGDVSLAEWKKLDRLVKTIGRADAASASEREVCRATYRRVTAHLIDQIVIGCGPNSAEMRRLRKSRYLKMRALYEGYQAAR